VNANTFGKLIKELRNMKGFTQEKLSEGICTKDYIYKIEKGKRIPSGYIMELLSNKLGENLEALLKLSNYKNPINVMKIQRKLNALRDNCNFENLALEISRIEDNEDFMKGECLQFILFHKAVILFEINNDIDKALNTLIEALQVTKPIKKIEDAYHQFCTQQEIRILNGISKVYCRLGDIVKSINILEFLVTLIRNKYSDCPDIKLFITIQYNLARYKIINNNKDDALAVTNNLIDYLLKNEAIFLLGETIFIKAQLTYPKDKLRAIEYYNQSLLIFKIQKSMDKIKVVENKLEEISN
jgi:transcriptional regulator with XRE-family HTH domain